jgi:hypothetical protein
LAITAAISDFMIPPPSALNFKLERHFYRTWRSQRHHPNLGKVFGFNRRQRRANACFIEANHLETNADIATTAFSNSWTTTRIQNITANV